jgi:2-polyprenyl-3-methyl-5-hydroxy-6-metoxy-1,4-benzoquinol methylase
VEVSDTPHYALAMAINSANPNEVSKAEEFYRNYLLASWGNDVPAESLRRRIDRFRDLFFAIKKDGLKKPPILTYLTAGRPAYVVDGNHRVAIAAALGLTYEAEVWPLDLAFLRFNRIAEFYGSGNLDLPYQGIFVDGIECIAGRRNDLLDRLKMVPEKVLVGQEILDVASNVGVSSLLALSFGAKSCLGLEISQPMVDLATKFAMFSNRYPAVHYQKFDLDNQILSPSESFDTAFMFSIHSHLKDPSVLLKIAKFNVRKFIVFEGHPNAQLANYAAFLNSEIFGKVTELGRLHTSRFKKDDGRILWLCEKK